MPVNDFLKDEIEVPVNGDTFVFAIPTIHDEIKRGARMRALLQQNLDAGEAASLYGLDVNTTFYLDACATFELLLKRASVTWVFTAGATGPKVISSKFPADKVDTITEAFVRFRDELGMFRSQGITDTTPLGKEAVAGQ